MGHGGIYLKPTYDKVFNKTFEITPYRVRLFVILSFLCVYDCSNTGSQSQVKIKSPRPLRAALDRERFLITDKHIEILDWSACVMVISLALGKPSPYIDHSAACT